MLGRLRAPPGARRGGSTCCPRRAATTDTWNNPNLQLYVDDAEQGGPIMAAALAAWGAREPGDLVVTGER